jgi:hypothetical protein
LGCGTVVVLFGMLGTMRAQSVRCDKWENEQQVENEWLPVGPGHPGNLPRKERKSKEGVAGWTGEPVWFELK